MALDVFNPSPTIVVDAPGLQAKEDKARPSTELASWVMGYVKPWRDVRDSTYKADWDSYYRTWRGTWDPATKTRKSERSRLIAPASMMAVDLAVAEIVEAIFGRDFWFDLPDDIADEDKADAERARGFLMEDLYKDGIIQQLTDVVLCGALYGTGLAKIVVDVVDEYKPRRTTSGAMTRSKAEVVKVYPVALEPGQFVPDPSATNIDAMLGCGVEMKVPLHKIHARQRSGVYNNETKVGTFWTELGTEQRKEEGTSAQEYYALITEWHGLVPKRLLVTHNAPDDPVAKALSEAIDSEELVEAIVTIANEGILLRAIANYAIMDDRGVASYQHSHVPNRFWGRGVMEKGKHPQKALDAEMRSRIDSLAWIGNPMIAGDLTKLPARMDMNVWPGKFWGTKGNPAEVLTEFRFGDINASTFQQSQELERQLQQATGALDSVMSIRGNIRDETATGSAMAASGFVKRSKLTMFSIETFLDTLIRRILWRKMQFEPEKYGSDYEFQVKGTIGMMAREIEQQFMVNLLQFSEQGTPPYLLIMKAIMEQSSSPVRTELRQAIDAMLNPPPPDPEQVQLTKMVEKAQAQLIIEEVRNKQADTAVKLAGAGLSGAKELLTRIQADLMDDEMVLKNMQVLMDKEETSIMHEQNEISREKVAIERQKLSQSSKKASS